MNGNKMKIQNISLTITTLNSKNKLSHTIACYLKSMANAPSSINNTFTHDLILYILSFLISYIKFIQRVASSAFSFQSH